MGIPVYIIYFEPRDICYTAAAAVVDDDHIYAPSSRPFAVGIARAMRPMRARDSPQTSRRQGFPIPSKPKTQLNLLAARGSPSSDPFTRRVVVAVSFRCAARAICQSSRDAYGRARAGRVCVCVCIYLYIMCVPCVAIAANNDRVCGRSRRNG